MENLLFLCSEAENEIYIKQFFRGELFIMEMRGIVKWFDVRKGFGFITDEEGMDYFVHY